MGEISPSSSTDLTIGALIQCQILHVTSDMVVVSFDAQDKRTFQGALLFTQQYVFFILINS